MSNFVYFAGFVLNISCKKYNFIVLFLYYTFLEKEIVQLNIQKWRIINDPQLLCNGIHNRYINDDNACTLI